MDGWKQASGTAQLGPGRGTWRESSDGQDGAARASSDACGLCTKPALNLACNSKQPGRRYGRPLEVPAEMAAARTQRWLPENYGRVLLAATLFPRQAPDWGRGHPSHKGRPGGVMFGTGATHMTTLPCSVQPPTHSTRHGAKTQEETF